MEKRFEIIEDIYVDMIKDNQTCEVYGVHQVKALTNLLNEQDEEINRLENLVIRCSNKISKKNDHIKKLQKENQQLKEEIKQLKFDCAMFKSANYLVNEIGIDKAREIMFQSEQKLKQTQNSKAIEVLERLRNFYNSDNDSDWIIDCCKIDEYINNQITELSVEK